MKYPKLKHNGYTYEVEKQYDETYKIVRSGYWMKKTLDCYDGFFIIPTFYSAVLCYKFMKEHLEEL